MNELEDRLSSRTSAVKVSFGLFEADLKTGELWKAGFRVKLQSQPFRVLSILLLRPGEVVTREELQKLVWGAGTTVEFDHSLGTAINKLREAIGDSADNPRFVETLSRRGYRFVAPVQVVEVTKGDKPEASSSGEVRVEPGTENGNPAGGSPLPEAATGQASADVQAEDARPSTLIIPADGDRSESLSAPTLSRRLASKVCEHSVLIHPAKGLWWRPLLLGFAGLLLSVGIVLGFLSRINRNTVEPPHIGQVTHEGQFMPTLMTMEGLTAAATDGVRLFASTIKNGHRGLSSVELNLGTVEPLPISEEVAAPALGDISPDGSKLLLRSHLSPESEQPLWVVPTSGGGTERVGDVLAHDATWMPGGKSILYAFGDSLFETQIGGGQPTLFAKLPGRAFWLRWRPGADLLRFTIFDPLAHGTTLWQLSSAVRAPQQILTASGEVGRGCCGVWLADGTAYTLQAAHAGLSDLWLLHGASTDEPERLTDGPFNFEAPVAARSGRTIYFLGVDQRSELKRLGRDGELVPERSFLANAVRVDLSRDGHWIAWTDEHGSLWRARVDGTNKLQLTNSESLDVFLAHWSPDGTRLALMARKPGRAWQISTIDAQGGNLHPLLQEDRNAADPSWSADGSSLVFGRVNDFMGKETGRRTLQTLQLRAGTVSEIPGSEDTFSPRWSPDGRYITALTLDQRQVRVYTVASQQWTTLPVRSGADPVWSPDSRTLFVHASMDPDQPIVRIHVPEMQVEGQIQLTKAQKDDAVDFVFVGLAADGTPLIRLRTYTGNVYSLQVK